MRQLMIYGAMAIVCTGLVVATMSRSAPVRTATSQTAPPPDAMTFASGGIDGGGLTNVIAADPFHAGVMLAGQDTSGMWRTTDYGDHWLPVDLPRLPNQPLFADPSAMRVQSLKFDPKNENFVYAALGDAQNNGGFVTSVDGGQHWHLPFTPSHLQVPGGPSYLEHPTGHLIDVDEATGQIFLATYQQGIMRSDDGGNTWATVALSGKYLRSIAVDPKDPTTVYAAVLEGGTGDQPVGAQIWKVTGADAGTPAATQLSNSPDVAEDLLFVGNKLFAAAAYDGIFSSSDGGATWSHDYQSDEQDADASWKSLAGSGDTILAGSVRGRSGGTTERTSIIRSTDGGSTWSSITSDPSRIHFIVHGTQTSWWHADPVDAPGGNRYAASSLVLDPFDSDRLFSAGKSGVWRTDDVNDTAPAWYPAVRGLNVTFNWDVEVDPADPGRVYVGDTDWSLFYSDNRLNITKQTRPFQDKDVSENVYDIALDPDDLSAGGSSRVYTATEAVGAAPGDVYTNPDPVADPKAWTGLGLSDAVEGSASCGTYRDAIGVSVNHRPGSEDPIVLAAVNGCGLWRKNGTGSWQQVLAPGTALGQQASNRAVFAWPKGSNTVYLYDHQTGVWKSDDFGATWSVLWSHPLNEKGNLDTTGYLATSPNHPDLVYVTTPDGLYRIDSAAGGDPVAVAGVNAPGPLAVQGGTLYVAGRSTPDHPLPTLSRSELDSDGNVTTWKDLADDRYRAIGQFPHGLAVSSDGSVYVALRGKATVVGRPVDTPG